MPGSIKLKDIPEEAISENYTPRVILISEDRARVILMHNEARVKKSREWSIPLSVAISATFTLSTTDFKDEFIGLPGTTWQAVALIALGISLILTVHGLYSAHKYKESLGVDAIIKDLRENDLSDKEA